TTAETYGITIDGRQNIWVATWQGIAKFDGRQWSVPYTVENHTLSNNHVHAIAFDSQGDIWVGHIQNGVSLYRAQDNTWLSFTAAPGGLGGNNIRGIVVRPAADGPESVWFATEDGGISKFQQGVWTAYRVED